LKGSAAQVIGVWRTMADRTEELRATAAQCLALSRSTTDPRTRTNLLIMAQKLYDMPGCPPHLLFATRKDPDCFEIPRRSNRERRCSLDSSTTSKKVFRNFAEMRAVLEHVDEVVKSLKRISCDKRRERSAKVVGLMLV
jgi:hypothetical protein